MRRRIRGGDEIALRLQVAVLDGSCETALALC